jgi:hypothetical protein
LLEQAEIAVPRVAAVHGFEDRIRAGLHGEVQIGHQLFDIAVGGDEAVGHVVGVAGGVADARQAIEPVQRDDEVMQAAFAISPRHLHSGREG